MTAHAKLSPSASERWISCPASIRMESELPPALKATESIYAHEGTLAHALGELEAAHSLGKTTKRERNAAFKKWKAEAHLVESDLEDMQRHVADYVALIHERKALHPHSQVLLEQRVQTGIPGCWGTSDTVIVSPEHVEIIDLKYGQGVPVSAVGNSQLRLYGVGALDTFGDVLGETQVVRMTVFQPRLDSCSTEELSADELRAWRDSIIPIAEEAARPDAHFGPSEEACRWCPAAGICRARMERLAANDFGRDPDHLEPEELADLLGKLPEIKDWVAAVEDTALRLAYSGGTAIPGWKVVLTRGRRFITDHEAAIDTLVKLGYAVEDIATRKVQGIGVLEKLLGKKGFETHLGDLVAKSTGQPAIVPEDDERSAVDPEGEASKEFGEQWGGETR